MPKVLVADDNAEMLETLERIFSFYGFDVLSAVNGQEAVNIAKSDKPDLIVLDGMMPVMDGFEACRIIKSGSDTGDIPIVFLTANYTDPEQRVIGLELGADDYMLKPFNSKELVARSKSIIKRAQILQLLKTDNEKLNSKNNQIQSEFKGLLEQSKTISKDSLIEPLTGLYSLNFFNRRLKEEFKRAHRYEKDLSLVVVQINSLEQIEETFGQHLSNYVVMKMANGLLSKTRTTDVLSFSPEGRFYIILPETDKQGAFLEAERIRLTLSAVDLVDDDILETLIVSKRKIKELKQISFNLGVASVPETDNEKYTHEILLRDAKEALKQAISSGKDKTAASEE